MSLTNMTTIISKVWPPTEDHRHVVVLEHRDGRKVKFVHGPMTSNPAQRAMLDERGIVYGTCGSIAFYESFPGEPVCQGCVGEVGRHNEDADGNKINEDSWMSTSPDFKTGVRSSLCPDCRERETQALTERFLSDMKILNNSACATKPVGR